MPRWLTASRTYLATRATAERNWPRVSLGDPKAGVSRKSSLLGPVDSAWGLSAGEETLWTRDNLCTPGQTKRRGVLIRSALVAPPWNKKIPLRTERESSKLYLLGEKGSLG